MRSSAPTPTRWRSATTGEWLKDLSFADLIRLASKRSVSQVLEREDFRKRLEDGTDVRLHELLYPLVQGYDSVMVRADVEMGGADQLLNNLVGRDLQKDAGQEPQVVVVTPLLVGTDGSAKMSKSKGNAISPHRPARRRRRHFRQNHEPAGRGDGDVLPTADGRR